MTGEAETTSTTVDRDAPRLAKLLAVVAAVVMIGGALGSGRRAVTTGVGRRAVAAAAPSGSSA